MDGDLHRVKRDAAPSAGQELQAEEVVRRSLLGRPNTSADQTHRPRPPSLSEKEFLYKTVASLQFWSKFLPVKVSLQFHCQGIRGFPH